nr:hypothetical protein BJQ95_02401 [Cryobacterium sp. SO1]
MTLAELIEQLTELAAVHGGDTVVWAIPYGDIDLNHVHSAEFQSWSSRIGAGSGVVISAG